MKMDTFLEWYCGPASDAQGNSSTISDKTCTINAIAALPHTVFIIISTVTLVFGLCSTYRNVTCIYLRKFPAHFLRWLLLVLFILLCACSVAEGILTDLTYRDISPTQPQLYLPAILTLLGAIFSLVYYHNCECWQALRLLNLLMLYWIVCAITEILKLYDFHVSKSNEIIDNARHVISIINFFVYCTLAGLEIFLQCKSCWKVSTFNFFSSIFIYY